MILFYTPEVSGNTAIFPPEESKHIGQVLRKQAGGQLTFVDGQGGRYLGQIEQIDRKGCQVTILDKKQIPKRPFRLHLAIAPTKQPSRMEWLLEKVTEIGVEEITLLECRRSERQRVKLDRWERILQSAMKQSLQAYLPQLNEVVSFDRFIEQDPNPQKFIGWCAETEKDHLKNNLQAGIDVSVLIGPEGDFTDEEVKQAREMGYKPIKLGPNRLRTETAGLIACHIVNLINE